MLTVRFSRLTKSILLAVCSGALFFGFFEGPMQAINPATPTETIVSAAKVPQIAKTDVSVKQAIKAYQDKYPKSDVKSLSLEKKTGKYYYEIEGIGDQKEYELKVDAQSKKISDTSTETLDQVEQNGVKRKEDKLNTKDLLSVKKAVKEAQKKVKSGKVTEVSLNKALGTTYWEVEFQQSDKKVEVQLNAATGKFLAKETSELDD